MLSVAQGGTLRLSAVYKRADNTLVDPGTPLLEIMTPAGVTFEENLVPTRESVGQYHYDWDAAIDAQLGIWIARFTGVIDGAEVSADEEFSVVEPGFIGEGALITLNEYRTAVGIDPTDTRDDAQIMQWIPYASQAIRSFTERDFGSATVTETRTFEYDGSGYLDIDDASAITAVAFEVPNQADIALDVDSWAPKPERRDDAPVYQYILLPGYVGETFGSPDMGFTRNLDLYARERGLWGLPSKVKVTGTWGWPAVPGDVKMATIWTLQEWASRPTGEALTSEAIEGWSRSWGGRGGSSAAAMAIPARARDILVNYARIVA